MTGSRGREEREEEASEREKKISKSRWRRRGKSFQSLQVATIVAGHQQERQQNLKRRIRAVEKNDILLREAKKVATQIPAKIPHLFDRVIVKGPLSIDTISGVHSWTIQSSMMVD